LSFLTKLFSRKSITRVRPGPNVDADALQAQIGKTINDALAAAGLSGLPASKPRKQAERARRQAPPASLPGTFVERGFVHRAGKRRYKLYVPARHRPDANMPLLLMLHGCTQSPDDFAAGTRMNALAEQHGFLVAYPAQPANANGSKCWNWFRPGDQTREGGEPALLAALAQSIAREYGADSTRVFVAGLSAGAAMAVILGATYPDVFAAVGSHSGLPYRAAHDVPSAFAAMGGGDVASAPIDDLPARGSAVVTPLIVFQGDRDKTVAPGNADRLVRQAIANAAALAPHVSEGKGTGRRYTRTTYTTMRGDPLVESWQVHGGGHAWSGGSVDGTFTDPQGPDASAEMVRFFLEIKRQASSA
jgi:poly(hydroxyalkanoate) depolymerase family esterase